jgi:hypothetical protein
VMQVWQHFLQQQTRSWLAGLHLALEVLHKERVFQVEQEPLIQVREQDMARHPPALAPLLQSQKPASLVAAPACRDNIRGAKIPLRQAQDAFPIGQSREKGHLAEHPQSKPPG